MLCWFLLSTWLCNRYTHVPSLSSPTPAHPAGCHRALDFNSCVMQEISTGYLILHTVMYVRPCHPLSSSHPLLPSLLTSLFSMSASPLLADILKWFVLLWTFGTLISDKRESPLLKYYHRRKTLNFSFEDILKTAC